MLSAMSRLPRWHPKYGVRGHAHAVAGDRFDLDDVGTEVADDHRPERPGEVLTEVDEPDAFERVHQHLRRARSDLASVTERPQISSLCSPTRGCGP